MGRMNFSRKHYLGRKALAIIFFTDGFLRVFFINQPSNFFLFQLYFQVLLVK